MTIIIALLILAGLLAVSGIVLLMVGLKLINRLVETNRQLMILVAGREAKPEALRALVASAKLPLGKLKGVATGKKKEKRPANTDYVLAVGEENGI